MTTDDYFCGQPIASESQQQVALFKTRKLCLELGFNEVMTSKIITAVSELTRNILKYAGTGQLSLCRYSNCGRNGLEIQVSDNGPGIDDIDKALQERFSSGGTLGLGLPAVKRMMDDFEISSSPNKGTKVLIRKYL